MAESIEGLNDLLRRLARMQAFCESPSAAFTNDVTSYMITSVRTNFDSGGRPKWTPRKKSYPHPPLMKTKTLYRSIGEVRRIQNGTIEIGTNCEYAGYQHDGTKHIDARPFFVWQEDDMRYVETKFLDEIERML